jgi:hypothetical protein
MKTYQLNDEQFQRIADASKSVPYILGSNGIAPRSPSENANDVWRALGDELGFVWDTAQPISGSDRQFIAEPK